MSENETLVHGNLSKAKAKKGETPSIEFKYDESTGELSFRSNGILVDKGYVSSHGLVTRAELEEALKKLVPMSYVEIKGSKNKDAIWELEDVYDDNGDYVGQHYGQKVDVINAKITPNSKVDFQIDSVQFLIFKQKDLSFFAVNDNCEVTVYCIGKIPENDYRIQVTVTEVFIDG